jgi:hypothetical protein
MKTALVVAIVVVLSASNSASPPTDPRDFCNAVETIRRALPRPTSGFARIVGGVGLQRRCWREDLLNQYWISGDPCQTAGVHGPLRISVRSGKA